VTRTQPDPDRAEDQVFLLRSVLDNVGDRADEIERELRNRETLLSRIMDTATVAIFLVDRAGIITHANQCMAEMFACPLARLIGSEYVAHVHPDERATSRARMLALLASDIQLVDLERRYWRDDGSEFWGRLTGRRFQDAHGNEMGLVGVIADINERKLASQRHAGVVESSMDGFLVVGPDGRLRECNQALCTLTGYAREEVMQLALHDLHATEMPEDVAARIAKIVDEGHQRFETRWRRHDDRLVDVEITASYLSAGREICLFARDITVLKAHHLELDRIAHFDPLTGVPNRSLLSDRMRQAVAQSQRSGDMMAVCYLDLDGFKPINDSFGHAAGDRVLVEIAKRLQDCLRGSDTVARMGGDEFVLLLQGIERSDECQTALTRILDAIAQPMQVGDREFALSASLGAALYPKDDVDTDTLLRHADQAMYIAKQSGRNRFHFFDPEHDRIARERTERLSRIAQALRDDEFILYYQPQVDMRSGRVQGVEALIRWQHPQRGLLPPADFLSVIEDNDLIVDIGDWVIARALDQLDEWRERGLDLRIAVNIAARHLLRSDFVTRLRSHLAAHPQINPQSLELEVLETAALADLKSVSAVIRECGEIGVAFSLDDFGTGYSSLAYLKALPAETLKIDQTFVRDMLVDVEDRAIVEGVIGLARVFRRGVIAEGVETADHGTILLGLGCHHAQGYGIARPMPAVDIPAWVTSWRPDPAWCSGVKAS
jgi:diguanylate cyclase (GGDEF)-like protein/PAS domain S-box-containing protein